MNKMEFILPEIGVRTSLMGNRPFSPLFLCAGSSGSWNVSGTQMLRLHPSTTESGTPGWCRRGGADAVVCYTAPLEMLGEPLPCIFLCLSQSFWGQNA